MPNSLVRTALFLLFVSWILSGSICVATELTGSWKLVRVDNVFPDGHHMALYGDDPQGLLIFDTQGRYALQIFRKTRAPFLVNDKSKGTADEYKAAALGSNAHFGSYRIDKDKLVFHIAHASFPNWDGTEQIRAYTLRGDELIYRVPVPTSGDGAIGEVVWKRAPD